MAKTSAFSSAFDAFNDENKEKATKKAAAREASTEELLFAGLVKNIAAKWASHEVQLVWTTSADLMSLSVRYSGQLNDGTTKKVRNQTRQQIRKTLNALILLLKANYPDNYHNELKHWGFGKERY